MYKLSNAHDMNLISIEDIILLAYVCLGKPLFQCKGISSAQKVDLAFERNDVQLNNVQAKNVISAF